MRFDGDLREDDQRGTKNGDVFHMGNSYGESADFTLKKNSDGIFHGIFHGSY